MVVTDVVRFATATGMAVSFAVGEPPLALLATLAAVPAGSGAFFFPAFVSLRPLVVPGSLLQSANATISLTQSAAQVGGPVLGGFVVAQAGPVWGFAINAATFLWSAACASRIQARADRSAGRAPMWAEVRDGFGEIRSRDWLWTGLTSAGMFHVASGLLIVLVEVIAVRDLGGARTLGLIIGAQGVGGVLGGLVALRFQPTRILSRDSLPSPPWRLLPLEFA